MKNKKTDEGMKWNSLKNKKTGEGVTKEDSPENKKTDEDLNKNSLKNNKTDVAKKDLVINQKTAQVRENEVVENLLKNTNKYIQELEARKGVAKEITLVVKHLRSILTNKATDSQTKIKNFYQQLNSKQALEKNNGAPVLKNNDTWLKVIEKDTSRSALKFIIGIALVASSILIVPGLIMCGLYLLKGRHPFEFLIVQNIIFSIQKHWSY